MPTSAIDASHSGQSRQQSESGSVCLFAALAAANTGYSGQSGSKKRFMQIVRRLGAVRAVRGKCICHGMGCVAEFGLGVVEVGFRFHGMGGFVIETWLADDGPGRRQ